MENASLFEPPLGGRLWPLGKLTTGGLQRSAGANEAAWVTFKLAAAEWYLATLNDLYRETGDLDRYFGVELALDGFLYSASSAFDAAVAALIEAIEEPLAPSDRTPAHQFTWHRCKAAAGRRPVVLACEALVDSALNGEADELPVGWLAIARRVRNRSAHHSTLSRFFSRTVTDSLGSGESATSSSPTQLSLPNRTAVDPIEWAEHVVDRMRKLVETMASDLTDVIEANGC